VFIFRFSNKRRLLGKLPPLAVCQQKSRQKRTPAGVN